MTPSHRLHGAQAYGRAADAFEAVAWKTPAAPRFNTEIADEAPPAPEPTVGEMIRAIPGWAVVVGGAVVAAMMGAMLGGALQI